MKKVVLLLLFMLLFPIESQALGITKANITGPSEIKQGESAEYLVDLQIEGVGIDSLIMSFGIGIELEYDSSTLVIEDITAANSEVILGGTQGNREIASYFQEDKISYSENCVNNVFCNTYQYKLNVYAKGAGTTNLKVKNTAGIFIDLSKGEDITEDDIIELENPVNVSKSIKIAAATTTPVNVPKEPVESTEKVTPVIPTITKLPTTKPKTTTTQSTTTSSEKPSTSTTEKTTDLFEEELKKDKEKRDKINKKIFFYGGIGLAVIVVLIILRLIINKIKDRKLDKALKEL